MAGYNSPLGNKQFGNPQMREFVVDDESQIPATPQRLPRQDPQQQYQEMNYDQINDFAKRFNASQSAPEYSEQERQAEEQIRQQRIAKQTGKVRLSPDARKRIEMLLGMTRMEREVPISGEIFVLQTLKSRELEDVMAEVLKCSNGVQEVFVTRRHTLARALKSIAGVAIDMFIGSDSLEDRLYFIDEQDHNFLAKLYTEYTILFKESEDKYAIKTVEQAAEVAEDLKK